MSDDSILIRPATVADGESVLAWTQNTFSWGDYISEVWDRWVQAENGQLLVAEVEGRVVGALHVVLLGNREGWMEGMRVHPDFRKRGIATALDLAGQKVAHEAGCRLVRLETASTNLPAQSAIVTYGYRRILNSQSWDAPGLDGEMRQTRPATRHDARGLQALWEGSWMRRALHGLAPMREGWRWGELTTARLRDYIEHKHVWVTPVGGEPRGMAIVKEDEDDIGAQLVVGRALALRPMLADLRVLADRTGHNKLYVFFPVSPRTAAWAKDNGFTPHDHTMFLYECRFSR